ncbi:hypothetical protein [Scytonema sp. PCC 10023]|uniref:hypothetical protein n=1 Tax=Scytonema sp. PCC 10023 TaxID=1680591 RepID=UPI0039C71724
MLQSFSPKTLLIGLQQISPYMLLLSLILHGILLAIPISSLFPEKTQLSTTAKNEETAKNEKDLNVFPVTRGTQLFSADKTLVTPKPPVETSVVTEPDPVIEEVSPPLATPEFMETWEHSQENALPEGYMEEDTENREELIASLPLLSPSSVPSPVIANSQEQTTKNKKQLPTSTTKRKPYLKQKKKSLARASKDSTASGVVSDFSTNTSTQKVYVDSLPGYIDKPDLQTSEMLPQISDKEAFDTTFLSLGREIILTADLNFAEPDKFSLSKPGVENIFGTAIDKTPDELALLVKTKLEAQGFQVSQINTYGGGPLYKVKKNTFSEYISFAPTIDGTGAIIVTWRTAPVSVSYQL